MSLLKNKFFSFFCASLAAFTPYFFLSLFASGGAYEKIKMAAQCALGPFLLVYSDPSEWKQIFHSQNYFCWIVGLVCVLLPALFTGLSFFLFRNRILIFSLFFISVSLWLVPTLVVMGAPA